MNSPHVVVTCFLLGRYVSAPEFAIVLCCVGWEKEM